MSKRTVVVPILLCLMTFAGAARSDVHSGKLHALERQIQELEARIAALEARETFTSFMPTFAERFHVMHHAGEAGDWAVASHELQEMKRIAALSTSIDAEKGELMQSMMAPVFAALEDAIEHGNGKRFGKALTETIGTCNACHVATGSDFVEVTLDVPDRLSLRHPHRFAPRAVPEGHTHAMPSGKGKMMHEPKAGAHAHDDAAKGKHTH